MKRPNIVLFVLDQLMPMMTGAYGNPVAHTPNIDGIASEGVRFDAAYSTCPVCVPARISLLTGKYLSRLGCYDNGSILSAEEPTHNHYLNCAGYSTALAGKAHFIGPEQLHGFQQRFMTDIFPAGFNFMPRRVAELDYRDLHPNPIAVDYLAENVGVRQSSMQIDYDEETVLQAVRFLRNHRSQPSGTAQKPLAPRDSRPFFLQVSFTHPHEPFHVLKRHWDLYADKEIPIPTIPSNVHETYSSMDRTLVRLHGTDKVAVGDPENLRALHRAYLASVSYADEKVGQVLDALDDFGLSENTVVILISDHGDMLGHRRMVQKRVFYEQSARIALLLRYPPKMRTYDPGTTVPEPVSIVDVAPTVLDIAGIRDHLPMDGKSLIPNFSGNPDPDRFVFCENYSEGVTTACIMARQGAWKYTYIHPDETQLFNVESDPGEWNNLSGSAEHAGTEAELRKLVFEHFDPAAIDRAAQESYEMRMIVRRSIEATGLPSWNYRPPMDVDRMYWRNEEG